MALDRSPIAAQIRATLAVAAPLAAANLAQMGQAADTARKVAAMAAFFTAFAMLVGAFIAAVAATIAGHRRDEALALGR